MPSPMVVLRKYFGQRPDQSLRDFADEVNNLEPQDKAELAELAAAELGLEVD